MRWFNPGQSRNEPGQPSQLPAIIPIADEPYTGQDMELGDISGPLPLEIEDIAGQPFRPLAEGSETATLAESEVVTFQGDPGIWV